MAEMIFYHNVVALNSEVHAGIKIKPPVLGYFYARRTNSVPILANEAAHCALEYPIVFVQGNDGFVPIVLLGLRDSENLYVNISGEWDARYVPAFVRRYPFVPGRDAEGKLVVCIDEKSPCLGTGQGEPLFAEGVPTPRLESAVQFLDEYNQIAMATEALGRRIGELGLLRAADPVVEFTSGEQFRLSGPHVIDEVKLQALDKDTVHELFISGALGLIHAHLVSLGNFSGLLDRLSPLLKGSEPSSAPSSRKKSATQLYRQGASCMAQTSCNTLVNVKAKEQKATNHE